MVDKAELKMTIDILNGWRSSGVVDRGGVKRVAAFCLGLVEPGPLGTELFDAIARHSVTLAVEAVCLRRGQRGIEVLLTQRPLDDTAYPGEWHCPGSVLRPGEEFEDVFERLADREFRGLVSSWRFVGEMNNPEEARGHFVSRIYLVVPEGEPKKGEWFTVDDLPKNTVDHHRDSIIPYGGRRLRRLVATQGAKLFSSSERLAPFHKK